MEAVSEKLGLKLRNWPQTSQCTEKINIQEAKQRIQETSLNSRAMHRSTMSAIDLSKSTLLRNKKILIVLVFLRTSKPVLIYENRKHRLR